MPAAVSSVLGQSFDDYEYLVIDNGSRDRTREVMQGFKDKRVRYVNNPLPSLSCDAPRNLGLEMARGKWVAFLDDDDRWYLHKLASVKQAIDKNPGAVVICHDELKRIYGQDGQIVKYGPWREDFYENLLYERNCLSPSAMSIRTDILRSLNGFKLSTEIDGAADYELWLRIAKQRYTFYFIDEALGEVNFNASNGTFKDRYLSLKTARFVKKHILEYENKPLYKISRRGLWRILKLYLIGLRAWMFGSSCEKLS